MEILNNNKINNKNDILGWLVNIKERGKINVGMFRIQYFVFTHHDLYY